MSKLSKNTTKLPPVKQQFSNHSRYASQNQIDDIRIQGSKQKLALFEKNTLTRPKMQTLVPPVLDKVPHVDKH